MPSLSSLLISPERSQPPVVGAEAHSILQRIAAFYEGNMPIGQRLLSSDISTLEGIKPKPYLAPLFQVCYHNILDQAFDLPCWALLERRFDAMAEPWLDLMVDEFMAKQDPTTPALDPLSVVGVQKESVSHD